MRGVAIRWRFILMVALFASGCGFTRAAPAVPHFELQRDAGPIFTIKASAEVTTTPRQVWQVLTAYNRLAEFVPDMQSSRLVERREQNGVAVALVEQVGQMGLIFFKRNIRLMLRVTEHAPDAEEGTSIDMVQSEGKDMKRFSARYVIERLSGEGAPKTLLRYEATIEPDFFVPPLIGTAIMRSKGQQQFEAVVREIERVAQTENPSLNRADVKRPR